MTAPANPADTFRAIYEHELDEEARWLAHGAVAKVDSIEQLLGRAGISPDTVLELGCGTGAVIRECQRRGVGRELTALDYAPEAIDYLRDHSRGICSITGDITRADFTLPGRYDVVVLSHVLEHLEDPSAFLRGLVDKLDFGRLVVEVPLEDLPAARLKTFVRDRRANDAGHVQFFTAKTFRALLGSAGLRIAAERRYVPVLGKPVLDELAARHGWSAPARIVRFVTNNLGPRVLGPVWSRLYYAHFAALCERAP